MGRRYFSARGADGQLRADSAVPDAVLKTRLEYCLSQRNRAAA